MPARYRIRILVGSITDKRSRSAAPDRSAIDGFQQSRRRWFGAGCAPVVKVSIERSALVRLHRRTALSKYCLRPQPSPMLRTSHKSRDGSRQEHHAVVDAGTDKASTSERFDTACQYRTRLLPSRQGRKSSLKRLFNNAKHHRPPWLVPIINMYCRPTEKETPKITAVKPNATGTGTNQILEITR